MHRPIHVVLAACAVLGAGCTWDSIVPRGRPIELPENAPRTLRQLTLCQPVSDVIDCSSTDRECNHWYRLDVKQAGELRVRVRFGQAQGGDPNSGLARLVVRPLGEAVLGQAVGTGGEPLAVTASVVPDVYGVLVQGGGAPRSYELWAACVEPGTSEGESCPSDPEPQPDA